MRRSQNREAFKQSSVRSCRQSCIGTGSPWRLSRSAFSTKSDYVYRLLVNYLLCIVPSCVNMNWLATTINEWTFWNGPIHPFSFGRDFAPRTTERRRVQYIIMNMFSWIAMTLWLQIVCHLGATWIILPYYSVLSHPTMYDTNRRSVSHNSAAFSTRIAWISVTNMVSCYRVLLDEELVCTRVCVGSL